MTIGSLVLFHSWITSWLIKRHRRVMPLLLRLSIWCLGLWVCRGMTRWASFTGNIGWVLVDCMGWWDQASYESCVYSDSRPDPSSYIMTWFAFWRCVYVHVGLYCFLNVPLADRYPVIPWYITDQWSTDASISASGPLTENVGLGHWLGQHGPAAASAVACWLPVLPWWCSLPSGVFQWFGAGRGKYWTLTEKQRRAKYKGYNYNFNHNFQTRTQALIFDRPTHYMLTVYARFVLSVCYFNLESMVYESRSCHMFIFEDLFYI